MRENEKDNHVPSRYLIDKTFAARQRNALFILLRDFNTSSHSSCNNTQSNYRNLFPLLKLKRPTILDMSIPGLALPGLTFSSNPSSTPSAAAQNATTSFEVPTDQPPRFIDLKPRTEYRFETSFSQAPLGITLLTSKTEGVPESATAELFGTELVPNVEYKLQGVKAAVYTWYGCQLRVQGETDSEYVAEETEMTIWSNLHGYLEGKRSPGVAGPKVLVVGPQNSGKTSLIETLVAYSLRSDRNPLVVNLDPAQGMLAPPGSFSAATFGAGRMIDVEDAGVWGPGGSMVDGPSKAVGGTALTYHFGEKDVLGQVQSRRFMGLVERLGLAIKGRMARDPDAEAGGLFVDTSAALAGSKGDDAIARIVDDFEINMIIILGSERLSTSLSQRYPQHDSSKSVKILKLPKPGGCAERDSAYMQALRASQVRSYFYNPKNSAMLSPFTQILDFSIVQIYKNATSGADESAWNPGDEDEEDTTSGKTLEKVTPSVSLQHSILAIAHATAVSSEDDVSISAVLGYVYVTEVDETRKKIRLLAPGTLGNLFGGDKGKVFLCGSWPEDVLELAR
ncbi:hypothetical protein K402DRAFT_389697 [Aulographum hederae CBS 113979]|uniref:Polynucleotide 5'-hydroxyl-kinase GRC3 n=1 Tax=Aulographum hederae CBS 113979 TaxID=1176131 RepID=A0A6G1HCB1_9PEZI|nr:hypothetical protein K402DRAFT_389697 [Aulographum hederae CBS 113979]